MVWFELMCAAYRNNLKLALDLYKKAETYVPENVKLKERLAFPSHAYKPDLIFTSHKRAGSLKLSGP